MTRQYSAYRDSGVAWLGQIPEHWSISQSRRLFAERKERARPEDKQLTASQKMGIITQEEFISAQGTRVMQVITGADILKHVEPNDFVISMRSFEGGLEHSDISGCISSAYVMIIPNAKVHSGFFKHCFKSVTYIQALQSTTNLVRDGQALRYENFCNVPLTVPPLSEQLDIAAFLDRETAKIDALVAEQRRLIDLLREKRQAVISHTVTKGLNLNVALKPSGIDWLGDVPEGWEVVKLSAHFTASKGPRGQTLTKEYCGEFPGEFPVYSGQTDNNGVMGQIEDFDFDVGESGVLFSTTVGAKAMTVSHLRGRFSLSQNCMIISPTTGLVLPRFFFYHFQPLFAYFREQIPEHMQASFRMSDLYQFKVALPPITTQASISKQLDEDCAKLDTLTNIAETAIALLQERRVALISAAVTGKIDVRHLSPAATEAA